MVGNVPFIPSDIMNMIAACPSTEKNPDKNEPSQDAPPADETEGLEAFADETDCGPLCKLERLVDKLSK